jgi:hypothetical protein
MILAAGSVAGSEVEDDITARVAEVEGDELAETNAGEGVSVLFLVKTKESRDETTEDDAVASEGGASVAELRFVNKATPKFKSFDAIVNAAAKKKGKGEKYNSKKVSIKRQKHNN